MNRQYICIDVPHVWDIWGGFVRLTSIPDISTALMRPRRPKQYCLQLYIYIYIEREREIVLGKRKSGDDNVEGLQFLKPG